MADFVLTALQKMNSTADTTERLRLAANALQTLGWRHTVIIGYESAARLLVVTPGGALYTAKPGDMDAWKPENIPPDDEQSITLPVRLPTDNALAAMIRLETPINNRVNTPENRNAVELIAFNIGNVFEYRRVQVQLQQSRDQMSEQVDELMILQSMDDELNSSLNLENVMMLAADWALRRTRSRSVMVAVAAQEGEGLVPLVSLGFPRGMLPYNAEKPMPLTFGAMGQAASTRKLVYIPDTTKEPDAKKLIPNIRSQIAVPLEMQSQLLGVLALESERVDHFQQNDIEFIRRLAARTSVALDNARLYNKAEQSAEQSRSLYKAGRAISATLEREEILPRIAQSIALVVGVSVALVADYRADRHSGSVLTVYRIPSLRSAADTFPLPGTVLDLQTLPSISDAVNRRSTVAIHFSSSELAPLERELLSRWNAQSALALPMYVGDEIVGLLLALETRAEHRFTREEILLFEALGSQSAVAFRQAKLYEEVRELENLKSEMIRMASHDLRNPLGNITGYIDLISLTLGHAMTEEDREYFVYMKKSATTMKSIIDDLLTLEKIESERQSAWRRVDFGALVYEVYDALQATAELKHQSLLFEYNGEQLMVLGSTTQLRQAVSNLVGNGLKYTRDGGRILIRLRRVVNRVYFEVEDNGYGISPERQKRLFQRFYRAKQPGTEEIPGTGLGLSMVKTVIERHGGEVWVQSEQGIGSTFGCWLPDAESMSAVLRNKHIELDESSAAL